MPDFPQDWHAINKRQLQDNAEKVITVADFDESGNYYLDPHVQTVLVYLPDATADDKKLILPSIAKSPWSRIYIKGVEQAGHTNGKVTVEGKGDEIDTKYTADLTATGDRVLIENINGEYWHEYDKVST